MSKKKIDSKKMMAGFIAFIMISSIFGVILGSLADKTGDNSYNGYKFTATKTGIVTKIDKQNYAFYNTPQSVLSFNISKDIMNLIKFAQAYSITFENNVDAETNDLTSLDVVRLDLTEYFMSENKLVRLGITEYASQYPQMKEVITCENATQFWPVILLKDAETSSVEISSENPYCIVVASENYLHRIKFRDSLIYRLLGIIEE